jgi:hypothetical protein
VVELIMAEAAAARFDPREVTEEYARLCKDYRIKNVVGDLYSHQWVQQAWRDCNVTYQASDLNASMLLPRSIAAVHARPSRTA